MKKYVCLSVAVLAFTLMANCCLAQGDPLFHHISPDAYAVYEINSQSILSKIPWADLMARIPAAKMGGKGQEMMDMMKNVSGSGIDIHTNILITGSNKDMADSPGFSTFILHLADSSKFRAFLVKETHDLKITRHADGSYSAHKEMMALAWNKEFAVVVMVKPPMKEKLAEIAEKMKGQDKNQGGAGPKKAASNYALQAVPRALAALRGWSSSSISDDPDFKTAFSDDADFHMYTQKTNYAKVFQKMFPGKGLSGLNLDALTIYKNAYSAVWFGNGKIVMRSTATLMPQVAEDLEKFAPPALNPDLLARLPKGNLLGLLSIRMNLSMIGYMLNRIGLRSKVDSVLATKDLTLDDCLQAFKGDVLLAAVEPPHTDSFQKPKPIIYGVVSVGDPAALNKLSQMIKEGERSMGDDSAGKKGKMLSKLHDNMAMKDNIIVISSSKDMAEGYFSNAEKRDVASLTGQMQENPTYIWLDLNELVNFIIGPVRSDDEGSKKMKMMNALHVLDKMIVSKSALHDGKVSSYFEISVTNKDQNILKTLVDLAPAQ